MLPIIRFAVLTLLLLIAPYAPASTDAYAWDWVSRIVAVGDVHGHYQGLEALLIASGLVDDQLNWRGGTAHFVSVGDLVDRGPESRRAMDLLMTLQDQAQAAGGRVHVVLGNHELMNLTGELKDVSAQELASHGGLAGHRAAFAPDGRYGAWLLGLPSIVRINDTLFVHGGLSSLASTQDLVSLNQSVSNGLRQLLTLGGELREAAAIPLTGDLLFAESLAPHEQWAPFEAITRSHTFGITSLHWYRGTATCHPLIERPRLERALRRLSARRVVIGHTPTPTRDITPRFDDQVIAIDTGMLASVYKGKSRALELVYADGAATLTVIDAEGRRAPLEPAAQHKTSEILQRTLSKRASRRARAAYLLDDYLGLGFVPPTNIEAGDRGIAVHLPRSFTEATRMEQQISRPNECESGSAYDLLAAYDALVGNTGRDADALRYNARTWGLIAVANEKTFGSQSSIPQYTRPVYLPAAMVTRLEAMNAERLETLFEGLLSAKQIKALLKRRDRVLEWPTLPEALP